MSRQEWGAVAFFLLLAVAAPAVILWNVGRYVIWRHTDADSADS